MTTKEFITVSDIGAIRVLGVPLGTTADGAKNILNQYGVKENKNCLYVNVEIQGLPRLNVTYSKSTNNIINEISITNSSLNQKQCDFLYDYFKRELKEFNIITEFQNGDCTGITLANYIHRVGVTKQRGLGDDENKFPFSMRIIGKLIEGGFFENFKTNQESKEIAIRKLYSSPKTATSTIGTDNNPTPRKDIFYKIMILAGLIIAFLFALNGRYEPYYNSTVVFDKWKCKAIEINMLFED